MQDDIHCVLYSQLQTNTYIYIHVYVGAELILIKAGITLRYSVVMVCSYGV